jgi:hypothetical protein
VFGTGASREPNGRHYDLTPAGVRLAFQPIVSVPAGVDPSFEVFARWPARSRLGPRSVDAQAAATARVGELDRMRTAGRHRGDIRPPERGAVMIRCLSAVLAAAMPQRRWSRRDHDPDANRMPGS